MKKILISQRIIFEKKTKTLKDALDHQIIEFFYKNNFIPISIPNIFFSKKIKKNFFKLYLKKTKISGVVLSGGNDIGEFKLRDDREKFILNYCKKNKIPVLGICRGMQLMAVYENVKLKKIHNHVRTRHKIYDKKNKLVAKVNSYHNWTIQKCPKNYEILYHTKDGSIEGIVHKKLRWEGWMWHPERENKYNLNDLKRLRKLFR